MNFETVVLFLSLVGFNSLNPGRSTIGIWFMNELGGRTECNLMLISAVYVGAMPYLNIIL